jgi:hypothetical protein
VPGLLAQPAGEDGPSRSLPGLAGLGPGRAGPGGPFVHLYFLAVDIRSCRKEETEVLTKSCSTWT